MRLYFHCAEEERSSRLCWQQLQARSVARLGNGPRAAAGQAPPVPSQEQVRGAGCAGAGEHVRTMVRPAAMATPPSGINTRDGSAGQEG